MPNNNLEVGSVDQEAGEYNSGVRSSELGVRGKKTNHWLWWVLGIIILAGIAGGAYYYWTKNKVTTTPTTATTTTTVTTPTTTTTPAATDATADWKTYTNIKHSYQFKYPLEYHGLKYIVKDNTDYNDKVTFDQFMDDISDPIFTVYVSKTCSSAVATDTNSNSNGEQYLKYIPLSNDQCAEISTKPSYQTHKELIDQILSTFTFTP